MRTLIIYFFNLCWRGSKKRTISLNVTDRIDMAIDEFDRVYNIRFSRAQLIDFLLWKELGEMNSRLSGVKNRINLTRLNTEYNEPN